MNDQRAAPELSVTTGAGAASPSAEPDLPVPAGGKGVLAGGVAAGRAAGALVAGDEHPLAVYLARLAPGSRRTQAQALHTMARLVSDGALDGWALPWGQLRYAHTHGLRAVLAERYAPATANRFLAALRGVLREAWRLGQLSGEDLARAVDLPPVRGSRLPAGRAVSSGELAALFGSCGQRPGDIRDAALLAVLYGGGLRRAEAVALEVGDFDPVQASLRVLHGKGRKARFVYLPAGAVAAVTDWVVLRGPAAGPLFHPVNRGGRIVHERSMSGQAVRDVLRRRAAQAGVAPLGPHDLRRTFVSDALDRGADISVVAALCGHASPTTTARYDRRGEVAKKRAAELLFVPYTGTSGRPPRAD